MRRTVMGIIFAAACSLPELPAVYNCDTLDCRAVAADLCLLGHVFMCGDFNENMAYCVFHLRGSWPPPPAFWARCCELFDSCETPEPPDKGENP
ncbi:MAG: hypothetical protein KIT79_02190 [Deltaproteobacteria bacterium]|nr:hypothetical protein [Deltaproteobacteria bacterium]